MPLLDNAILIDAAVPIHDSDVDAISGHLQALGEERTRLDAAAEKHREQVDAVKNMPWYQQVPRAAGRGIARSYGDVMGTTANAVAGGAALAGEHQFAGEMSQAAQDYHQFFDPRFDDAQGLVGRTVEGIARSLPPAIAAGYAGGLPAIAATQGAIRGSQAIGEAQQAGLSPTGTALYAGTQGGIAAATAGIQKFIPGAEAIIAKGLGANLGLPQAIKAAAASMGRDIAIGEAQGLADLTTQKLSVVNPDALNADNIAKTAVDVLAQSAGMTALAAAPHLAGAAVKEITPLNKRQVAQFTSPDNVNAVLAAARKAGNADALLKLAEKPDLSRGDWQAAGLPREFQGSSEARKEFAGNLKALLDGEAETAAAQSAKNRQRDARALDKSARQTELESLSTPELYKLGEQYGIRKGVTKRRAIDAILKNEEQRALAETQGEPSADIQRVRPGEPVLPEGSRPAVPVHDAESAAQPLDAAPPEVQNGTEPTPAEFAQRIAAIRAEQPHLSPDQVYEQLADVPFQYVRESFAKEKPHAAPDRPAINPLEPPRTETGTAPPENGPEVRGSEGAPDRRGNRPLENGSRGPVQPGTPEEAGRQVTLTPEYAAQFAREQPDAAAALAKRIRSGRVPSDKEFASAGLPEASTQERTAFSKSVRDALAKQKVATARGEAATLEKAGQPASLTTSPSLLRITPGGGGIKPSGAIVGMLKKWMTSAGNLPKEVFELRLKRDGTIGRETKQMENELRDLRDSFMRTEGTDKLSDKGQQLLNAAMHGDASALSQLAPDVQKAVTKARAHVDALSRRLIDNGLATDQLEVTIDSNMGTYLTRSYQVFDDPAWLSKAKGMPDVWNKAFSFLKQEYRVPTDLDSLTYGEVMGEAAKRDLLPALGDGGRSRQDIIDALEHYHLTDQQIANKMEDMLTREGGKALVSGKLGSKDLSILKRRKDIAPEIRALLGEYKDPIVNFARSITKMSHLAANHEFLARAREAGLGKFFFDENDPNRPSGYSATLAAEGSSAMAPLNGLKTTPEIKAAFDGMFGPKGLGGDGWDNVFRHYMKVVAFSKYAKTVGNPPQGWFRNFMGNPLLAIAAGHWNLAKLGSSFRAASESISNTLPYRIREMMGSDEALRTRLLRYAELGLTEGDLHAGELRDALNEAVKPVPAEVSNNPVYRLSTKGGKFLQEGYQSMDNVWRLAMFESELDRYRSAYERAGKPVAEPQLEERVAGIIRDTFPTYAMIPEAVKSLRRAPVVGTFVSFPSEVLRTFYKNGELAYRELQDPALKGIGAQRAVGMLASLAIPSAITAAFRSLIGVTRDDDNDLRRFLPQWSQNSDIVWLYRGTDSQKPGYIDLSFTVPNNILRKPVMALLRGDNWSDAFVDAAKEFATPFFSIDMLLGTVGESVFNKTLTGGQVYNEQASGTDKLKASMAHIGTALEPGGVTTLRRLGKAAEGYVEKSGRSYGVVTEVMGALGFRAQEMDIPTALSREAGQYASAMQEATKLFSTVYASRGTVRPGEVAASYKSMEDSRRKLFDDLHAKSQGAINLGVSRDDVAKILDSAGLSKEQVSDVMSGSYMPYTASKAINERAAQQPTFGNRKAEYEQAIGDSATPEMAKRLQDEELKTHLRVLGSPRPQSVPKDKKQAGMNFKSFMDEYSGNLSKAKAFIADHNISRGEALSQFEKLTAHLEPEARRRQKGIFLSRLSAKD